MRRQYIDRAIRLQLARMDALLRDIRRSGGKDGWPHLFSRGHAFPTVLAAIRQGYITQPSRHKFKLTAAGTDHLRAFDGALMAGISA